jgi:hypothetical protein
MHPPPPSAQVPFAFTPDHAERIPISIDGNDAVVILGEHGCHANKPSYGVVGSQIGWYVFFSKKKMKDSSTVQLPAVHRYYFNIAL